jgi:hypothetical protein
MWLQQQTLFWTFLWQKLYSWQIFLLISFSQFKELIWISVGYSNHKNIWLEIIFWRFRIKMQLIIYNSRCFVRQKTTILTFQNFEFFLKFSFNQIIIFTKWLDKLTNCLIFLRLWLVILKIAKQEFRMTLVDEDSCSSIRTGRNVSTNTIGGFSNKSEFWKTTNHLIMKISTISIF